MYPYLSQIMNIFLSFYKLYFVLNFEYNTLYTEILIERCDDMSTFMFKKRAQDYTPVSNIFIDKYMPAARGDFVKVYLLGLKYCTSGELGVNSSIMASALHLLETDVVNAWNYWNDEGIIRMVPIDNMGNYNIEFLDIKISADSSKENINLLNELENNNTKDMLQDIEKLLCRTLSPKEMTMYISWQKDLSFTPEIILLLIQYCVSRGKTDYRYIERVAIGWHEANIKTIDDAQAFIKNHEEKWMKIRKIMTYLGANDGEIMKPQEEILSKWINTYKFSLEIIYKACDICFQRINKADFKYIDRILSNWYDSGVSSVSDIENKNFKHTNVRKAANQSNNSVQNKGSFNNYSQRTYDFEKLEKELMEWENNYD